MPKKQLKKCTVKSKLRTIKSNNGYQYDCLKAVEELNELSTVLTQSLTKNNKSTQAHIIEEFGDVKFRLGVLINYFNRKSIKKRYQFKLNKSIGYLKTQKYDKV